MIDGLLIFTIVAGLAIVYVGALWLLLWRVFRSFQ